MRRLFVYADHRSALEQMRAANARDIALEPSPLARMLEARAAGRFEDSERWAAEIDRRRAIVSEIALGVVNSASEAAHA